MKALKTKITNLSISGSIRVGLLALPGLTLASSYQWVVGGHPFLLFLSLLCLSIILFIGVIFGVFMKRRITDLNDPVVHSRYGSYYDDFLEKRYYFFAFENGVCIVTSIILAAATSDDKLQIAFLFSLNSFLFLSYLSLRPFEGRFTQYVQTFICLMELLEIMIALLFVAGVEGDWLTTAGIFINLFAILSTVSLMLKDPVYGVYRKIRSFFFCFDRRHEKRSDELNLQTTARIQNSTEIAGTHSFPKATLMETEITSLDTGGQKGVLTSAKDINDDKRLSNIITKASLSGNRAGSVILKNESIPERKSILISTANQREENPKGSIFIPMSTETDSSPAAVEKRANNSIPGNEIRLSGIDFDLLYPAENEDDQKIPNPSSPDQPPSQPSEIRLSGIDPPENNNDITSSSDRGSIRNLTRLKSPTQISSEIRAASTELDGTFKSLLHSWTQKSTTTPSFK
jgi:hypothetical protein